MGTAEEFDVIVIGAGPAGENVAGRCAAGGLRVVLIEREKVGGECSFWACIPSKALLRPGEALAQARRVPGAREAVAAHVDVQAALRWRDEMIHRLDDASQVKWVRDAGVTLVRGHARLAGERHVVVTNGGAPKHLRATRAVVLATGSSPVIPPIEGLAETKPWTSREATTARHAPERFLVLGGGPVGVELAQAWKRLGSRAVSLVEGGPRLLSHEEPFAGNELATALRADGIAVLTHRKVVKASRASKGEVTLHLDDDTELKGDELLVAVGRRPATGALGLDTIGLDPHARLVVDDRLRVQGHDWLYAIGDVNGRAPFTHMGKYQALIAADNVLGRTPDHRAPPEAFADHRAVPRITFTDPAVCAVGLTVESAREAGLTVRVVTSPTNGTAGAALHDPGGSGTCQLVIDSAREVIVGATFVGANVAEALHAATIALVGEVPLDRLRHAVPVFPAGSELWLRLLEAAGK